MKTVLILYIAALIVEQIFYHIPGSYLYKYGVTVSKIEDLVNLEQNEKKYSTDRMTIWLSKNGQKKYISYKYPFGILGPLVFLGVGCQNSKDEGRKYIKIKVGPMIFISFFGYIVLSVFSFNIKGLLGIFICLCLVYFFYQSFIGEYKKTVIKHT